MVSSRVRASLDGTDRALQHLADRSPMAEWQATRDVEQAGISQPID
jgi:hypothetical protein